MSDSEFEKARDEMAENTFESVRKPSQLTFKEIWDLSANWAREWLITNEKPTKYNKDDGRVCTVNPRLVEQVHKIGSDFVEKLALEQKNTELKAENKRLRSALERIGETAGKQRNEWDSIWELAGKLTATEEGDK